MKITCEACSARYSIADEKVAGRVFRFKCRRCDEDIYIRGLASNKSAMPVSEPPSLLDERNETSLLFSMDSLSGAANAGTQQSANSGKRSEGSGLLDIRKMASIYQNSERNRREFNDSGIFAPVVQNGPLMPDLLAPQAPTQRNRVLWALCGAAGVVAIAAAMLAIVVVKGGGDKSYAAVADDPRPTPLAEIAQPVAEAPTPVAETPEIPKTPAEPALVAMVPPEKSGPKTEPKTRPEPRRERPRPRPNRDRERVSERPKPPVKPPASNACMDEVACLLAEHPPACCSRYSSSKEDKPEVIESRPDLPEKLSRNAIKRGMDKVKGRVSACSAKHMGRGMVKVSIKVSGDGEVTRVKVKETPNPDLGTCVANAVRKANFGDSQNGASFSYPFVFK